MKGFVGVTDNDWFAFLSQQQGIDEVSFLPKQSANPPHNWRARITVGGGLDISWRSQP